MRVRFGEFVLDSGTRELTRSGRVQALPPKVFELLTALCEHRPRALSREELRQQLWPDTFVSDANLTWLVSGLRQVLGDDARDPRWVRTVPRFGYAFCGAATTLSQESEPAAARRWDCWLEWRGREISLSEGDHLVGRDPEALVCVHSPRVSRRHARLSVREGQVVLEDLGSRNGTRVDGRPVEEPMDLIDGAEIRIGPASLVFHSAPLRRTEAATRR